MPYPFDQQPIPVGLLQAVFTSKHVPALFGGQETHDPALRLVAQIVAHTDDVDRIRGIIAAALPGDYAGDTLSEIDGMVSSAVAKGFDAQPEHGPRSDRGRDEKTKKQKSLVDLIRDAEPILFHDAQGRAFMAAPMQSGAVSNLLIGSRAPVAWLRELLYRTKKRTYTALAVRDALDTLAAIAQFDGPLEEVHIRLGRAPGSVVIDLGREDGAAVEIKPSGWRVTNDIPIRLWRSPGFGQLPDPQPGGDLDELRRLLNLDDEVWLLILGFALGALRGAGPYLCLLIEGEQGSGKTLLCSMLKRIIDPHQAEKMRLASSERDLMIQAKEQHLLVFDNISGMKGEMSDALCVLATGGGLATRKLYTDDEQQLFVACRPFIINGITEFVNRPDLLERAILVNLPSMPEEVRKTEAEMNAEFDRLLPGILGRLYDAVAHALRHENQTPAPRGFRMADAARWITAAEPVLGLTPGSIVEAIGEAQGLAMVERIQNNPLILSIERKLEEKGPFQGTVGQLYDAAVVMNSNRFDRTLPATPAHLSRQLRRLRPAAAKAGIMIEFGDRHHDGKAVRVWRRGQEDKQATSWPTAF